MVKSEQQAGTMGLLTSHTTTPRINAGNNGKKSSSQYKGVRMRSWGSWVSEIRAPNQKTRIWLGSYSTAEAAARAYDAALVCLKGSTANLNFPAAIPFHLLPQNYTVMSPKSIQRVAAAAAANATAGLADQNVVNPSPSLSNSSDEHSDNSSNDGCCYSNDVELEEPTNDQDFNGSLVDVDAFFQSPKCMDYMLMNQCGFFAPDPMEDIDEEGEIRLWSFC